MISATAASGQLTSAMPLSVQPGSSVWIEGGSNVSAWSCKAVAFDARIDADSVSRLDEAATERIQRVTVKVAVRDLKCGNARMESDLCRALKVGDPSVSSDIVGIFNALPRTEGRASFLQTEGTLTVAGVEKPTLVQIAIEHLADGTVKARGSVPLLMTDFGVTPPTALLGLVRSHNEVTVKFELIIAAQP